MTKVGGINTQQLFLFFGFPFSFAHVCCDTGFFHRQVDKDYFVALHNHIKFSFRGENHVSEVDKPLLDSDFPLGIDKCLSVIPFIQPGTS